MFGGPLLEDTCLDGCHTQVYGVLSLYLSLTLFGFAPKGNPMENHNFAGSQFLTGLPSGPLKV